MIITASKDEDSNVYRVKERKKKTNKIPKNCIMNCVVSYDTDGNTVISKDVDIGDGSKNRKCPGNKSDKERKGGSAENDEERVMVCDSSTENNAVEIETPNSFEKIGRLLLKNENNDKMKSVDHSKYRSDHGKYPGDFSKDLQVIKVHNDDSQVADNGAEDLRYTKDTELSAETADPDVKSTYQERGPYSKHVYIKPPRFVRKENEEKLTNQMEIGGRLIAKTSETKETTPDLPPYLVTTTASSTPSFTIPKIPPPVYNVSNSNVPSLAIPNIPPPPCNVSSNNIPPYAPAAHFPGYSGSPTYMHLWPYHVPPSRTMQHTPYYTTTTQSTDTVSYSTNAPSYQTVQALPSRGPHMVTSCISTAIHGLASPQLPNEIPVPTKFDFPPPFISTTTPSLLDNQSHYLPPPMPQQFTEHQQHSASGVPLVSRNSPYNMCVPSGPHLPLPPCPNVNYPFQNQPLYVIGYLVNPNACIPNVTTSPVQHPIPPDCNAVCIPYNDMTSYNGSNGNSYVLPTTTSA